MRQNTIGASAPKPPRFAIVNTLDGPCRNMICEWVNGIGYCYMRRSVAVHLKCYDGMKPTRPTSIEDFGFEILVDEFAREAHFIRRGRSVATYEDGSHLDWQDTSFVDDFTLPLVEPVKGKRIISKVAR